jgi:4-hydroxy-tetrahydrodipicolinate reductase
MDMAALYCKHKTPFVMGTTGGDREKLLRDAEVRRRGASCVGPRRAPARTQQPAPPRRAPTPLPRLPRLRRRRQAAGVYAVIAPQMGKQVVAFQAVMEMMGTTFPGAFAGYDLQVVESHQSSKRDTSGTAKVGLGRGAGAWGGAAGGWSGAGERGGLAPAASLLRGSRPRRWTRTPNPLGRPPPPKQAIVGSFKQLGVDYDVDRIEMVRERDGQLAMGVPEAHLPGHAYHTYRLTSPDGTVAFEFQHNVCGRWAGSGGRLVVSGE